MQKMRLMTSVLRQEYSSFHAPGGHGVRLDTHCYSGYAIPPFYDSMIAKLIITARTREESLDKLERALNEFIVEGIKTTIPFHQQLLKNEKFREGVYTTRNSWKTSF